jgi:hypothetical protein
MTTLYIIGLCAIFCLLFFTGLGLMIHGFRKYDFNPLAFLVPFVGGTLSFPIFFMLKERALNKNSDATAKEQKRARIFTVLAWCFFAAMIIIPFVTGVRFFVGVFDAIAAGADAESIDATRWAEGLFWSAFSVCAAYVVALGAMCLARKKSQ